jgi:adenylate cyclase
VVAYSRHMGEDETGTRARFNQLMDAAITPAVTGFNGRVVKLTGDGILAEFSSVVDAVRAAMQWQREVARLNESGSPRQLVFRIGINLGDIIVEGDDIHGDGVNIAARLEPLAEPGGICLSRAARDQVRDKLDNELVDMGEIEVKNIARPIRAFRISGQAAPTPPQFQSQPTPARPKWARIAAGLAVAALLGVAALYQPWKPNAEAAAIASMKLPLPDKPSVVVMPFSTPSDEDAQLIGDSIVQDVTNYLSQVSGLFVIASSSSFSYKDKSVTPQQVSQDLGVRNVVQGRLRGAGENLSVTVQMIDGITGTTLWTEEFSQTTGTTFELKETVARSIARELAVNVARTSAPQRLTDSEEAYNLWYRASRATNAAPTAEGFDYARIMAESALFIDPQFGRGKAVLAYITTQNGYFGFVPDRKAALDHALTLARQAVELAPDDWYTHEMLGFALMNTRQYEDSSKVFDRAIELAPSNAGILVRSALPLLFLGRPKEAERRLKTAMRINPIYDWANANFLAMAYYEQSRWDEAVTRFDEAARLNPGFIGNMVWRAAAHAQAGNQETAERVAAELLAKAPKWTISGNFVQIKDPEIMELLNDGLRKAGLPE